MNVLQHTLLTKMVFHGDESTFHKIIPYVILPEAIVYYTEMPQMSHFEKNMNDDKCSSIEYPSDIFTLSSDNPYKNKAAKMCHLETGYNPYAIGGDIDITAFDECTSHLDSLYRKGLKMHLRHDIVYRQFLREHIDCERERLGVFQFDNNIMGNLSLQSMVDEISEWGAYVLAFMVERLEPDSPAVDKDWFEDNVISKCFSTYPYMMADYVRKTAVVSKDIDDYITNKDWSHFDDMPIPFDKYERMYQKLLYNQNKCVNEGL